MTHLILGSSGQIGTHMRFVFKASNINFIEFDILKSPEQDLRIANNEKLEKAIGNSDIVHFLAFDVGGSLYMKKYQNSFEFISNNVKIMNNVFDLIKKHNKPVIFASSQMSNMSHSTYGLLKAVGESYTKSLDGLIVKFWNVYGYESDPEKSHVITDFIKMAVKERRIMMRTNGAEKRQFLYGDDCAKCILTLADKYSIIDKSKSLHITSFKWISIKEIAELIGEILPVEEIIASSEVDTVQQGIVNQPDNYIMNFWSPTTDLKNGIEKVITLMKENKDI